MPSVVERLSVPLRMDRRIRGMTRHLTFTDHMARVRLERPAFLARHGGSVPAWIPPAGLRTTHPARAAL